MRWVQGLSRTVTEVIAMDGKTLRHAYDREAGKNALHLVRAWMVERRVVLAHLATENHSMR